MTTHHPTRTSPGAGATASARPAQKVGRIKAAFDSAAGLRRGMNLWPPFLLTGIHIDEVSDDFRLVRVRLRRTRLTTNYVGTQFGGSLFAMTDPFWMIMMMRNLGPGYVVWDKAGEIEFVAPGRTAVTAEFRLDPVAVAEVREAADSGAKVLRWFEVDVVGTDAVVVARVRKQLYVRRAPAGNAPPTAATVDAT
jgi:acyl-coenzyme A thioesterase PaaI-like protein